MFGRDGCNGEGHLKGSSPTVVPMHKVYSQKESIPACITDSTYGKDGCKKETAATDLVQKKSIPPCITDDTWGNGPAPDGCRKDTAATDDWGAPNYSQKRGGPDCKSAPREKTDPMFGRDGCNGSGHLKTDPP